MKLRIKKQVITNGGGDEETKPLSPQQRQEWNAYVDYVAKRGYKGSPLLDKKETNLSKTLFDDFRKENPNVTINYDIVPSVQYEMQKLKDNAQAFAERRNDPNAKNIMSGVSKVDGWAGSKTTQYKFPEMIEKQLMNNALVGQKNLGLVDSNLKPAQSSILKKPLPKGVKLERLQGGVFYEDPQSGDLVKYSD